VILGTGKIWASHFKSYDERLLERICEILPTFVAALGDNPHEDLITINLVDRFHLDVIIRRMFYHWQYQFEPFGHDENGVAYSKGKIDFVAFWDQEREKYLAYEAKRLNVKSGSGIQSNASVYVTKGLIRFVKEQYSKSLPVGCMLGYVLDGNATSVDPKVRQAIAANAILVGLTAGPTSLNSISTAIRFESDHDRDNGGGTINIRHALVPCI